MKAFIGGVVGFIFGFVIWFPYGIAYTVAANDSSTLVKVIALIKGLLEI